jgi:Putative Ig domain
MRSNFRAHAAVITLAAFGSALAGCNLGDSSSSTPPAAQSAPAQGAVGSDAPPAAQGSPANGASSGAPPAVQSPPAQGAVSSTAPTISGSPATSVAVGAAYAFHPAAAAAQGKTLTFAIRNKPAWTAFDAATGTLSGTPAAANVGSYAQISISVSDGVASASLAPFSIGVAQPEAKVTLSWTSPTSNTNGTTATDLAGYRIYYGSKATELTKVVTVEGAEVTDYAFRELSAGTWYFAVAAYNSDNVESSLSAVVPVAI